MSRRYGSPLHNGSDSGGSGRVDKGPANMRGAGGYGGFSRPSNDDYDPYGESYGGGTERYGTPPQASSRPQPPPAQHEQQQPQQTLRAMPSRPRIPETNAERQIAQVLQHIRSEWPTLYDSDCVPVQMALQLLDSSSVGRANEYRKFQKTHNYLQESLKGIVHEHHQGFNSSIGTFHKIQTSIQTSQKRVRDLKESLANSKTSLCTTDSELKKLSKTSQSYDEVLQLLNELDDLRAVPDQLEARISEKRFLSAVETLQNALRKLRRPELDSIGALHDLRNHLTNQETSLMDILVEELHEHLYLKSPYCQERWQALSKTQSSGSDVYGDSATMVPFHSILETIDVEKPIAEDPMRNPEADTFYYIGLLVESLNKLGRLQNAVETLKQRLPVELFGIVNETINEIDHKHPSSLRGGVGKAEGVHVYTTRETKMRADVIYDLLWTLYGKFEAISEGHRIFHESIKALIRREGAGNNSALLGSFKELWNLYQNEIRSLLHNYVTTDADVYHFDTPGAATNGKGGRENLFKFVEADAKAVDMATEYDALESIIQATVPGLTNTSRKVSQRSKAPLDDVAWRKTVGPTYGSAQHSQDSYKSLVEPSVFNMSLLLPPTLVFLQRLKGIVPPGSDLATSTLTAFLDNFLVNVFQPQLDETLTKLSDTVFGEADAFVQDDAWRAVARRPVFKGTTAFFGVVTAFCRMLGTIPPDQALSSLIVTQMMRYYDRCFGWFKLLVAKTSESTSSPTVLRASARFALDAKDLQELMKQVWTDDKSDADLLSQELDMIIGKATESQLEANDVIQDRDTISSLCLLYTSMKWLAVKISGLRSITTNDSDSSKQALRPGTRRWTLLHDPNKSAADSGPVSLPLAQDTIQSFDSIVSSLEELATTALFILHLEIRCQAMRSLQMALSPDVAPYLLEQEVREPDPQILSLNSELVTFDETVVQYLRDKEVSFIRTGLGELINNYIIRNAGIASPMNEKGCARMQLNILVLQQNLKNVEKGVGLARASNYFALYREGDASLIIERAKKDKSRVSGGSQEGASGEGGDEIYSYGELKTLVQLCYSVQVSNPERGIASQGMRQMDGKLTELGEHASQD